MNRLIVGFILGFLLIAGVGRTMVRSHQVAAKATTTSCTASGLAAYASGNKQHIEAAISAAVSGDEPATVACTND